MGMEKWGISLDRDERSDLDSFMELVETGERRVYLEYPTVRQVIFKLFAPVVAGFCITLGLIFIIAISHIVLNPVLVLAALFIPILIGFALGLLGVARSSRYAEKYGVRGVPRPELSSAISFLDMIREGHADLGKISSDKRPEDFSPTSSMALGVTLQVLNKIDPGLGTRWVQTLSSRLSEAASLKLKAFLRTTFFGTIVLVIFAIALEILRMLNLIDSLLLLQILVPTVFIAVLFVVALAAYAIKNQNADPPPELQAAICGPEIRNETDYVLDHLLTTITEEGEHPLRVLVVGNYDELRYTGRTYVTSREMILREAVLIPRAARL